MPQSSETYRRIAGRTGYRVEAIEKVVRLGELLRELDTESKLIGSLVLRGGTALNLELAQPPRLSVDLDFDYVGEIQRDAMLASKPVVLKNVESAARSLGYRVALIKDAPAGSSFKLDYVNALAGQDLLKVDISWTNRVGIEPIRRVSLWQPEEIDPVTYPLVGRSDLIAGKYRALIDRTAARDCFDSVQIARAFGESWPPPEVQNAFVFLTGTLNLPLTSYAVERVERLTNDDFSNNLLPMLSPDIVLDRDELVRTVGQALRPMLALNEAQSEFVSALDAGELKPELLFSAEVADRLAQHPHLVWKAQNRKKFLKDKP